MVQSIKHKSWGYLLVVFAGKVGHSFVGETEQFKRMTIRVKK